MVATIPVGSVWSPCSLSADAAFLRPSTSVHGMHSTEYAHKESLAQAADRVAASTMGLKLPVNEWSRCDAGSSAYLKPRPPMRGPDIGRISGQDPARRLYRSLGRLAPMARRSFVKLDASSWNPTREAAAPPQLAQWFPEPAWC